MLEFNVANGGLKSARNKKLPFSERFKDHFDSNGKPIFFKDRMAELINGDEDLGS
jgi:hypothetical protein